MGNYKPGSDIDIALFGNLTEKDRERIFIKLNEHTNIPYKIDLVLYNDNTSPELKRHIEEFGKALILSY